MEKFSDAVKVLRLEKHLTLEAVARHIKSHKGYVSGIENKKVNPPSVKIVRRFAKLFHKSESEMICMAAIEKAPEALRLRYQALEGLERAIIGFKKQKDSTAPSTEPPVHGQNEHALKLREQWRTVEKAMASLKQMFVETPSGTGHPQAQAV